MLLSFCLSFTYLRHIGHFDAHIDGLFRKECICKNKLEVRMINLSAKSNSKCE